MKTFAKKKVSEKVSDSIVEKEKKFKEPKDTVDSKEKSAEERKVGKNIVTKSDQFDDVTCNYKTIGLNLLSK